MFCKTCIWLMTCGVDKNACKWSKTHAYLNIFKSVPSFCTEASDEENYIICLGFVKTFIWHRANDSVDKNGCEWRKKHEWVKSTTQCVTVAGMYILNVNTNEHYILYVWYTVSILVLTILGARHDFKLTFPCFNNDNSHSDPNLWIMIIPTSDPTASGCTGTYSASTTLPALLAAKCDGTTCTTLQTSVANLGMFPPLSELVT